MVNKGVTHKTYKDCLPINKKDGTSVGKWPKSSSGKFTYTDKKRNYINSKYI